MRTTIDLPDELLRLAKARAALQGLKLRGFVAQALENAIYYGQSAGAGSRASEGSSDAEGVVMLGEDCAFPIIRGKCGPELRTLVEGKAAELMEKEDVDRAIRPRGR